VTVQRCRRRPRRPSPGRPDRGHAAGRGQRSPPEILAGRGCLLRPIGLVAIMRHEPHRPVQGSGSRTISRRSSPGHGCAFGTASSGGCVADALLSAPPKSERGVGVRARVAAGGLYPRVVVTPPMGTRARRNRAPVKAAPAPVKAAPAPGRHRGCADSRSAAIWPALSRWSLPRRAAEVYRPANPTLRSWGAEGPMRALTKCDALRRGGTSTCDVRRRRCRRCWTASHGTSCAAHAVSTSDATGRRATTAARYASSSACAASRAAKAIASAAGDEARARQPRFV